MTEKQIRFHHCDPAGIVFYPQYFILFNEVVEDWYARDLSVSFVAQISRDHVGIPLAKVICEFLAPSRIGDILCMSLHVKRIGRTSLTLVIEGTKDGVVRVRAELTVVNASLDTFRPVPFSDQMRGDMQRYLDDG